MFNVKAWAITFGILAVITAAIMFLPLWAADLLAGAAYIFAIYCVVNAFLTMREIKENRDA